MYDVVVVGAGPSGTSTAILLAERGFRVALLDKARFPRVKPCAEFANPEAVRVLDRLGLLQQLTDAGAAVFRGMRVISPGGFGLALDFDADAGLHALGLSRWALDNLAVMRCRELGVEVIEGARVREILCDGGRAVGVRASHCGQSLDVNGRVVVGADGHHSTVARLLNLDLPVRWPRRIGLAAHLENFPLVGDLGEMHIGDGGYCGIAPQEEGRVNAAMVVDMDTFEQRSGSAEGFFDTALRSYPEMRERIEQARRVSPVRGVGPLARRVRRVSGDGFLLVGDAAGFFDPLTGEGIFDALRGGELAADAIATALGSRDTSGMALSAYDNARRKFFGPKRRAAWLMQGFARSPWLMDYTIARAATRAPVASALSGVLGHYREAGTVLSPRFLWHALRP